MLFAQSLDAIPLDVVENNAAARREMLDEVEDDEQEDDDNDDDEDDNDSAKGIVVTYRINPLTRRAVSNLQLNVMEYCMVTVLKK